MAGFADAFSAENVQRLMSDPRLVLGLQLMQQGGWQPGNPSAGARLGQAGLGAMQQIQQANHSQQLQAYRQQKIAQEQQAQAFQAQQLQAKQEAAQRQQQAFQNPDLQSQLGPLARMLAANGVDAETILRANSGDALQAHRQAQLAQQQGQFDMRQAHVGAGGGQPPGPKMPTPRQLIEEPLPDGRVQKHMYDAGSGEYKPYGAPFSPHSTRGKAAQATAVDPLEAIVQHATGGGAPAEAGLGSLPGGASLASYAPQQNPTPSIIAGGANPMAAREPMRVPGQPKAATPKTKAEYDALPVGAMYQDPVSGKIAAKKAR